jgi:hypothetical protein
VCGGEEQDLAVELPCGDALCRLRPPRELAGVAGGGGGGMRHFQRLKKTGHRKGAK